ADRYADALEFVQPLGQAVRQGNAAGAHAYQHQLADALVALDHLVGDTCERAPHIVGGQDDLGAARGGIAAVSRGSLNVGGQAPVAPFRPRWTDLKASVRSRRTFGSLYRA